MIDKVLYYEYSMAFAITDAQFVRGVVGSHNLLVDEKPQIAFVGRSNVGKSSVINTLTGRRGLVHSSSTPGKTQQINFFLVNDKIYFVDLPGYGYAKTGAKARENLRRLILWYFISAEAPVTLAVVIVDAKAGLRPFDREMIAVLRAHKHPFVIVANKTDKLNQKELHAALHAMTAEIGADVAVLPCSTRTGRGVADVLAAIASAAHLV